MKKKSRTTPGSLHSNTCRTREIRHEPSLLGRTGVHRIMVFRYELLIDNWNFYRRDGAAGKGCEQGDRCRDRGEEP